MLPTKLKKSTQQHIPLAVKRGDIQATKPISELCIRCRDDGEHV